MNIVLLQFPLAILLVSGCSGYLDEKPDKSLVVPDRIGDLEALLNNTRTMNIVFPSAGTLASDDYYVLSADWMAARTTTEMNAYVWGDDVFNDNDRNDWSLPYTTVYNCNVILDAINSGELRESSESDRNRLRGQALFFRAFAFYELLQIFAAPWDETLADDLLGIPLRRSSDFNEPSTRASLKESYRQVTDDLKEAINILPGTVPVKTLPDKRAGHALLARVYLTMGNYEEALKQVDLAMVNDNIVLDYNDIDSEKQFPFARFNGEVIFHSSMSTPQLLYPPVAKVDTLLLESYTENDLRRTCYFETNSDGTMSFKGSYDGSSVLFNGLTTSELCLVAAESSVRINRFDQAMFYLRQLLSGRIKNGIDVEAYLDKQLEQTGSLLNLVLEERRKELVGRGSRWTDLRRLNKDPRFQKRLVRIVNQKRLELPPNDDRYVFPIPDLVIRSSGMEQNKR